MVRGSIPGSSKKFYAFENGFTRLRGPPSFMLNVSTFMKPSWSCNSQGLQHKIGNALKFRAFGYIYINENDISQIQEVANFI